MKIIKILISVLFCIGIMLVFSPFFLYWWIYGDYDRYLWIINGPFPYSHFGSGPFLLILNGGLFVAGIIMILLAHLLKKKG